MNRSQYRDARRDAESGNELGAWGWNDEWEQIARDHGGGSGAGLRPGRVIRHVHHRYRVISVDAPTPHETEVSGAFTYRAAGPSDFPTAGDWVLLGPDGRIESVLPRRSSFSRNAAGNETLEQVIVANVDVVFLVFGLDGGRNFTVGLLERSLLVAWNSGARPVVVLNKADCADADTIERCRLDAESNAPGVSIHIVSAMRGDGLDGLLGEADAGETVGLLGKSGVGKSALINAFIAGAGASDGPARTGEQRAGDRQGRHATTDKSLYMLPKGVILADVPGLRELQLWADTEELDSAFPEIDALAAECRFTDCAHNGEPGCRVQEALSTGELPIERYERYLEYLRELSYLERRRDQRAQADEQRKWRRIAKDIRRFKKR
jgi:ribosome biogenesis GTPase